MPGRIASTLWFMLFLATAAGAQMAPMQPPRSITVAGTGTVTGEPDKALVQLTVEKSDPAMSKARSEALAVVEKFLALTQKLGIDLVHFGLVVILNFMIAQVTSAALVAESRVYSHPASVDSIPSSAGREDHVSMGANEARHVLDMIPDLARVLGLELYTVAGPSVVHELRRRGLRWHVLQLHRQQQRGSQLVWRWSVWWAAERLHADRQCGTRAGVLQPHCLRNLARAAGRRAGHQQPRGGAGGLRVRSVPGAQDDGISSDHGRFCGDE